MAGHSIALVARSRIEGGIVIPSALAIFRLMTKSNLVGGSIGKLHTLTQFGERPNIAYFSMLLLRHDIEKHAVRIGDVPGTEAGAL